MNSMRQFMPPNGRIIVGLLAAALMTIAGVRWHAITTHYQRTMVHYRESLSALQDADLNRTARYALETLEEARSCLNVAQAELNRQNDNWLLLRDYTRADSLLLHAAMQVRASMQRARMSARRERAIATQRVADLTSRISARRIELDTALFRIDTYRLLVGSSMHLELANSLVDEGHVSEAMALLDSCEASLDALERRQDHHQAEETSSQKLWFEWVRLTVDESKRKGIKAVIVDKAAHRLLLINRGAISKTFSCDIGHNPAVQKVQAGDGATPEGMYRVTRKRSTGSSYYKALMLSYPNERDRRRFHYNRDAGLIGSNARIGGLIEIHGDGGQGRDWTDGCVALANHDMDELMKHVDVGTPVTIVRTSGLLP